MILIGFHRHFRLFFVGVLAASAIVLLAGCRNESTPPPTPSPQTTLRLISLSPAMTDILIDLGFESEIVGRGRWDEQLDNAVPRVGDLTALDLEAILMLDPTDIILQAGDQGTPPALTKLAAERDWNVINVQVDGIEDIRRVTAELPRLLSRSGHEEVAERLLADMDEALAPIDPDLAKPLGPILMLYGVDPPSAFGPGSYLSDVLESLGGRNAVVTGGAWQELDMEAVLSLDPWAILVVASRATTESGGVTTLLPSTWGRFGLRAVDENRVAAISHPQALLPGTCVIEVATEIRHQLEAWAREAHREGSN